MNRVAFLLGILALAAVGHAENYLANPGFEDWGTNDSGGYTFSYTGQNIFGGGVGAYDWDYVNYTYGTTTTERATPPPGLDGSGNYSVYVTVDTAGNGIGQPYNTKFGNPEDIDSASGWVYVTSGTVGIGYLDENGYGPDDVHLVGATSTENQWVFLGANLDDVPSYGLVILAVGGPASWYADNMDADTNPLPTPEPASLAALGLGALTLLRRKRRG